MGSYLVHEPEIYPKAHENPIAFSCIFGPIFLESSIQCPWGVGLHHVMSISTLLCSSLVLRQICDIRDVELSTNGVVSIMLYGEMFGCLSPIISVDAFLSYKSPFLYHKNEVFYRSLIKKFHSFTSSY